MTRIALTGLPGAGKGTFTQSAQRWAAHRGHEIETITLATPLYRAQAAVYQIAGRPLDDESVQDGELLNFLGSHLRKINPSVLEEHFLLELKRISSRHPHTGRTLVVCTDARPADFGYLRQELFQLVMIDVDPATSARRRVLRGDLTLGATNHTTETGFRASDADLVIDNNGTLEAFDSAVWDLLDGMPA
ncbi:hypothetical protein SK803_35330 [Lentzea sp. BCCO 10_0856]|uniref:Dephospho-CoA kinase n=1 Tax=Lentzea miocenica TaxID=3095431 RepID=A0ABU4TBG4_9PSEU|nr:hypothetical protein [Lentzea sp. BCCO 10_0856]MDX8035509.1 hypothetical protein [Lentzea sp. BCCO 10_0856]